MADEDVPNKSPTKEPAKRYKSVRRDPNQATPLNWQRKPHISDNIPCLDVNEIKINDNSTSIDFGNNVTCTLGDHIFLDFERDQELPTSTGCDVLQSFRVARIVRIVHPGTENSLDSPCIEVNFLIRPYEVLKRSIDTRELYCTFKTDIVPLTMFRGKCIVQNKLSVRNLNKYREKSSQFWVGKFYDYITQRVYDLVPVSAMKALHSQKIAELSQQASYAILNPDTTAKLCEASRKKRTAPSNNADDDSNDDSKVQKWCYRYYDVETAQFLAEGLLDSHRLEVKIGSDHQAEIDEWSGHNLRYYTLSAPTNARFSGPQLRYADLDQDNDGNDEQVDTSLPWVQEMPSGYIHRGGNATSTPVSIPEQNMNKFITKCRESCAKTLNLEACNVDYLDACCSAYTNNNYDETKALMEVMDLNKRQINIPTLSDEEKVKLRSLLNPFLKISWHDIFTAIGTKTGAEISRYYWTRQLKRKRNIAWSQQIVRSDQNEEVKHAKNHTSEYQSTVLRCAVCLTDTTYGWEPMPHYFSLLPIRLDEPDLKYAMCMRCARLWYRYGVGWREAKEVLELEKHEMVEPELIEDAKVYNMQEDKRLKRQTNAINKKQAAIQQKLDKAKNKDKDKEKDADSSESSDAKNSKDNSGEDEKSGDQAAKTVSAKTAKGTQKPKAKGTAASKKEKTKEEKSKTSSDKPGDVTNANPKEPAKKGKAKKEQTAVKRAAEEKEVTKKPKFVSPFSTEGVDQFLSQLNEKPECEAETSSYNCVVCGQLDPSMTQRTCVSCGLNVHVSCYGRGIYDSLSGSESPKCNNVDVKSKVSSGSKQSVATELPWFCDCCTNSRHVLNGDPFYQCQFCPQFPLSYAEWLNGNKPLYPVDALKMAVNKTWCHVRCAMFIPGVTFLDPKNYEGIDPCNVERGLYGGECTVCIERCANGYEIETWKDTPPSDTQPMGGKIIVKERGKYEIDHSNSCFASFPVNDLGKGLSKTGVKIKCSLCPNRFHVSCASHKHFKMGFTKEINPRPIVICSRHASCNIPLTPLSYVDLNLNLTVAQLYSRTHKKSKRWTDFTAADWFPILSKHQISSNRKGALILPFGSQPKNVSEVCSSCMRQKALCYYSTESGLQCLLCYTNHHWRMENSVENDRKLAKTCTEAVNAMFMRPNQPKEIAYSEIPM
ncbi:hypothetical protein DASB73_036610 [Starmerella bacillaris]|uniref:BAH domain-containing protein n=1 Tax=Starmerella bacillaris TaxID=1247836 RepID=A0AAV5RMK8_STABA|nr:hypothetical protein DASB73_036610 [Starmerella bacillaris]